MTTLTMQPNDPTRSTPQHARPTGDPHHSTNTRTNRPAHRHEAHHTLLCECCGYDLTATPPLAPCAECGRPASASHPRRRHGSPFQRKPRPAAFIQTTAAALLHPHGDRKQHREGGIDTRGIWSVITIESNRSIAFAAITLILAASLALTILALSPHAPGILSPKPAVGFIINAAAFLALLVSIEALGIQLVGVKNNWRISGPLASTIVSHAAPGWYTAAVAAPLGYILGHSLNFSADLPAHPIIAAVLTRPPLLLAALGLLAGLLHFEILVYLGVRSCRYANPPQAAGTTPDPHRLNTPPQPRHNHTQPPYHRP